MQAEHFTLLLTRTAIVEQSGTICLGAVVALGAGHQGEGGCALHLSSASIALKSRCPFLSWLLSPCLILLVEMAKEAVVGNRPQCEA